MNKQPLLTLSLMRHFLKKTPSRSLTYLNCPKHDKMVHTFLKMQITITIQFFITTNLPTTCEKFVNISIIWCDWCHWGAIFHYLAWFSVIEELFQKSVWGFHQSFQTLENNESSWPAASCFPQFSRVWKPWWNPCTRFLK